MSMLANNFGNVHTPYTALVTLADLIVYFVLVLNVGRARGRFKVKAPSTDGPPEFRRTYRVHMNTLEQMALNLPLLWLAAFSVGDVYAALVGLLWPIGRVIYARNYYLEAEKRYPGFALTIASNALLFLGATTGVIASL